MKKLIFMMLMAFSAIVVNAQTAVQSSKILDNVYVGVEGGVATPLTFDNTFPLNGTATLRVGKQFTPVWSAEVEGTAWFGSNSGRYGFPPTTNRFDGANHNVVRGTYVGVNGTVNLTNLFLGYNGTPRFFEVSTVLGTGWVHTFRPHLDEKYHNYLGVKTGLDLAFNLGKAKEHTVSLRPSVLWNVSQPGNTANGLAFNKLGAQLHLGVGYTYHFKTSNGTHHFKTYDIGSYEATIARLNEELAKKPKEVEVEVVKYVDRIVNNNYNGTVVQGDTYVLFAWNSEELDATAKSTLDKVSGKVKIVAYASPEGTETYNKELSQRRANAVADYLRAKGVTVTEAYGAGVNGNTSNRVAIVTVQ